MNADKDLEFFKEYEALCYRHNTVKWGLVDVLKLHTERRLTKVIRVDADELHKIGERNNKRDVK